MINFLFSLKAVKCSFVCQVQRTKCEIPKDKCRLILLCKEQHMGYVSKTSICHFTANCKLRVSWVGNVIGLFLTEITEFILLMVFKILLNEMNGSRESQKDFLSEDCKPWLFSQRANFIALKFYLPEQVNVGEITMRLVHCSFLLVLVTNVTQCIAHRRSKRVSPDLPEPSMAFSGGKDWDRCQP